MMPKAQFTTEYLGEFLDSDSILFTGIRECVAPAPTQFGKLSVGIDWGSGSGGDYTSVASFTDDRKMVFIDYFNDRSTFDQVRYICNLLEPYETRIDTILAENNSIGAPMIDLLKDECIRRGKMRLHNAIVPFTTTNREKVRLVNQLQVGLEQRNITLLDDPNLLNQLSAYEATYNPRTNVVTYNAPAGLHDDNCISTMLALDAVMQRGRNQTGMYAISKIC